MSKILEKMHPVSTEYKAITPTMALFAQVVGVLMFFLTRPSYKLSSNVAAVYFSMRFVTFVEEIYRFMYKYRIFHYMPRYA